MKVRSNPSLLAKVLGRLQIFELLPLRLPHSNLVEHPGELEPVLRAVDALRRSAEHVDLRPVNKVARWQNLIVWGRNPRKRRDQNLQRSVVEPLSFTLELPRIARRLQFKNLALCSHLATIPVKAHGNVVGQLASDAENDPLWVLHPIDVHDGLEGDFVKVEPVAHVVVRGDGLGVVVDHDRLLA